MQQKIFTNTPSLGFGALLNPFRDSVIRPPTVSHAPLRCYNCGGYSNIYSPIASVSGDWKCVFCGKGNDSPEGEYLKSPAGDNIQSEYSSVEETGLPLSHRVELFHRVVDYKEGSRIFSSAADTALGAPLIILLDENLKESSVINLKDSLLVKAYASCAFMYFFKFSFSKMSLMPFLLLYFFRKFWKVFQFQQELRL